MPQRFVEVLDVSAEAASVINQLASRAGGIASNLKFNVSNYINATANSFDASLVLMLEKYNVSKDDIFEAMELLNLNMSNTTLANIERPKPIPMYLMAFGSLLIATHLVIVHVGSRRLLAQYGHYKPQ